RRSMPLGRVEPRTTSPTGSGRAATWRTSAAMAPIRSGVRVSRSMIDSLVPASLARVTSSALAARISSARASRASAIASSAASFAERGSGAMSAAAVRARRAASVTGERVSCGVGDVALVIPRRVVRLPGSPAPMGGPSRTARRNAHGAGPAGARAAQGHPEHLRHPPWHGRPRPSGRVPFDHPPSGHVPSGHVPFDHRPSGHVPSHGHPARAVRDHSGGAVGTGPGGRRVQKGQKGWTPTGDAGGGP
ncbi:Hypothetical protein SCLAV_1756, partial [Streptomyces clavuligerus]